MTDTVTAIEAETIYPIPLDKRHGHPRDLFTIWFGSNMMMLTLVTGALATTVYALPLLPALVSMVVGSLIGGVFMALHAAQGPRLGVPQMVQTRGQFGSIGAAPITVLIVLMYIGFAASNLVLGGEGLEFILPGVGRMGGILIIAVATLLPVVFGYRMIHISAKLMSLFCGLAVLYCLFAIGVNGWDVLTSARESVISTRGVLGTISTAALWQIAYAPYVSDYSRYLPPDAKGEREAFIASFSGCVLGSLLVMTVGAMIGVIAHGASVVSTLGLQLGHAAVPILVLLSLGISVANAMNIYCGTLSTITVVQTFTPNLRHASRSRMATTLILLLISLAMALFMAKSFLSTYSEFLELLMSVMVPWTSINLTDYYLIHRGDYDVASFFEADGGRYGHYNKPAFFCYFVGILVQVPFLANGMYIGPMAKLFHGVDLSWCVGLLITTPLYWYVARRWPSLREHPSNEVAAKI